MDELIKILGLKETASASDVQANVRNLVSESTQNKDLIKGLRKKVENLEDQVTDLAKGSRDQRVEQTMSLVQGETKRFLGKDHTEKLRMKASQYVMSSDEDQRKELYEDMKTVCIAYGDNQGMKNELNSLTANRDDPDDNTPEHERQVEKLVNKFDMSYAEAIDIVTSGKFQSKMETEAK